MRVTGPDHAPANLIRLSTHLYCGAEPRERNSFQALRKLGIKTIVSVDGLQPNLKQASSAGLKYIHIPIGYGVLKRTEQLQIARVVQDCQSPIFVHCHHGKHRGPTAALIAWLFASEEVITDGKASPSQQEFAANLLEMAGTDPKYKGLWSAAKDWKAVSKEEKLPPIYEVTKVSALAQSMSLIDHAVDRIGTPEKAELTLDKTAATETTEGFRESIRWILAPQNHSSADPDLERKLKAALETSELLEEAIDAKNQQQAKLVLKKLIQQCSGCHSRHR